jgi:hypothetical protein
MSLINKYKPQLCSELEFEYPLIIEYLNNKKTFIVNGAKNSGKSTIVKLYLELFNYDYLLIDDFNLSKDQIIEKVKYKTNSVFSYFYNKNYITVVDNFDLFDSTVKEFIINNSSKSTYLIITNRYLSPKINYVKIKPYTIDYVLDLYCIIFFLERGYNCKQLPEFNNISEMFSILEFNVTSSNDSNDSNDSNENNNYQLFFDKFNYNLTDLVKEKNFLNKFYILDKLDSYSLLHNNIIYNYKNIDDLADSYENLSLSISFNNNYVYNGLEYYSILSTIGTTYKLNDFKIYKENFQIRKKKNFKYNY